MEHQKHDKQHDNPCAKPGRGASERERMIFWHWLMELYDSRRGEEGMTDKKFAERYGLCLRTFQFWKRRRASGEFYLRSRAPHNTRKSMLDDAALLDLVARIRNERQCGASPLCRYLKDEHGVSISETSVKTMLRRLLREKRIGKIKLGKTKRGACGNQSKRQGALCHALALPYARPCLAQLAQLAFGAHLQMDTVFPKYRNGHMAVVVAIDLYSRHLWALPAHELTSNVPVSLLERVRAECGLAHGEGIVQTDGGSEFMKAFPHYCQRRGVKRMVNPPSRPQCNAFVESANGTLRRECFNAMPADISAPAFRKALAEYVRFYNAKRCHSGLGGISPIMMLNRRPSQNGKIRNM